MGPFVNSVACLQKDHKKYPNLFCFVWLVNPEDSEKGLDIFGVWISEIMDSGAVPGMGDAGLPEKAPEVFIDISQCHRLSAVTREKISGRLWKRMDLPGIPAQPQCHGFRHRDQAAVMVL